MTDNIKLPPLPVSANFYGMYGEYTKSQVEALMREAVRLNAQAVPDGGNPVTSEPTQEMIAAMQSAEEVRYWAKYEAAVASDPTTPQPAAQQGDEREAFDQWFRNYQCLPDDADTTQYDEAFLAFKAWQARAALAAQAQEVAPAAQGEPIAWHRIEDDEVDVPLDTDLLLAWWDQWHEAWIIEVNYAGSDRGGWRHGRATHWMPLPAPPSAAPQQKGASNG